MADQIQIDAFRSGLLTVLEEIFEKVHGILLDPETLLFETLATVSAEEASQPVSAQCASLAAQVNHTRFYLDVMIEGARTGTDNPADWDGSWQVGPVNETEWQDLIARLRAAYQEVRAFVQTFEAWDAHFVGGAFAIVGHCAYHLGE